jgi:predicted esterase
VDPHEVLTTAIAATTHGRVLARRTPEHAGVLAGFHGYYENAEIQLARLAGIPGADRWTLLSIQGLHRFYRARTEDVVASWMTSQDRELAIADNIAYVDRAIAAASNGTALSTLVCAGFSQGVAMAFRAGVRGRATTSGIIAVGGDVPPELLADADARFPPVLLVRGAQDEYYPRPVFEGNAAALRARGTDVTAVVVEGLHDWTAEVSEAAGAFLRRLTA